MFKSGLKWGVKQYNKKGGGMLPRHNRALNFFRGTTSDPLTNYRAHNCDVLYRIRSQKIVLPEIKKFCVKHHFRCGQIDGVQISCIDEHFINRFDSKIDHNLLKTTAIRYVVKRLTDHMTITARVELHSSHRYTFALSQVWDLLWHHSRGEKGVLLENGYPNIFYVVDVEGYMWAVCVDAYDWGWRVRLSFDHNCKVVMPGSQVFMINQRVPFNIVGQQYFRSVFFMGTDFLFVHGLR